MLAIIARDYFPESETSIQPNNMILNSPDDGSTWYIQYQHQSSLPTKDSSLNLFINISDTLIYSFGCGFALFTDNKGGVNNPIMSSENIILSENISLYPNPANDFVVVNSDKCFDKYAIFSIQGIMIQQANLKGTYNTKIQLDSVEPGAYIISVFSLNSSLSQLLIKR